MFKYTDFSQSYTQNILFYKKTILILLTLLMKSNKILWSSYHMNFYLNSYSGSSRWFNLDRYHTEWFGPRTSRISRHFSTSLRHSERSSQSDKINAFHRRFIRWFQWWRRKQYNGKDEYLIHSNSNFILLRYRSQCKCEIYLRNHKDSLGWVKPDSSFRSLNARKSSNDGSVLDAEDGAVYVQNTAINSQILHLEWYDFHR